LLALLFLLLVDDLKSLENNSLEFD
jgi:hypothetical protein